METIQEINIEDAKQMLDKGSATFIDIRDASSHEEANIEGAKSLSWQNAKDFIENTNKDETLIVYCYRGNSSKQAVAWLQEQGFAKAFSLQGGFDEWRLTYP